MVTATTSSPGVTSSSTEDYYLTDESDNVIGLTSPTGSLTASYSYDPYGGHMSATGTDSAANPYRYASAYLDPTGLYKMGARYYNPATGALTQQDDVSHTGDLTQGNRFAYAGDDPVNDIDPAGTSLFGDILGDVGKGIAGIGSVLPASFPIGFGIVGAGLDVAGGAVNGESDGDLAATATLDVATAAVPLGGSLLGLDDAAPNLVRGVGASYAALGIGGGECIEHCDS
jgi:RHS repeat-associated protein